jgi:UMF1 family MFS transporter
MASENKQAINAWVLFPMGPKAFSVVVEVAILPVYFQQVAASSFSAEDASTYWKYITLAVLFLSALFAPFLGGIADQLGARKQLLIISNIVGIIAAGAMIFVGPGDWVLAIGLYLFASVGASCVYSFYDSFLIHIVPRKDLDEVSCRSAMWSYVSGAVTLSLTLLVVLLIFPNDNWGMRVTFLLMAICWAVASVMILPRLPEPPVKNDHSPTRASSLVNGAKGVMGSLQKAQTNRQLLLFLCAFGAYSGGISTIITMSNVYGRELGLGTTGLIVALALNQVVGIPASWLYGRLAQRIGAKRMVMAGLVLYTLIAIVAYFTVNVWIFWLLVVMVGLVQGGVTALNRSLFSKMISPERSSGLFGLYTAANRFSTIIGPMAFGMLVQAWGTTRLAMLSTLFLLFVGRILLEFVADQPEDTPEEMAAAPAQTALEQTS